MLPKSDARWLRRYQRLFSEADLFLCEGPHMRKCLINLGCPEEKVRIHHLALKLIKSHSAPGPGDPEKLCAFLSPLPFEKRKVSPMRWRRFRRFSMTCRWRLLSLAMPCRNCAVKGKRKILSTLARTGLEKRTKMLGYQKPIVLWEQAYQHQVFLSPSVTASDGDTEGGSPVAIIEMQASGMPVIATTHCDIPSVIPAGKLRTAG